MLLLFLLLFYVVALVAAFVFVVVELWQEYTAYIEYKEQQRNHKRFKALYRVWYQ